jgi:two-component system sensor histidine kinase PilS (NtrC family)
VKGTVQVNRPAILTQPKNHTPGQQNLALFRIYVAYRSLLALVLLIMLVSPNTRQLVGVLNPGLYMGVALAYLATSVPLVGSLSSRLNQNQHMLLLIFLVDIVAIILLSDSSGGTPSGLPALLVITVAASAVLIANRTLATLIAAISVLAMLGRAEELARNRASDLYNLQRLNEQIVQHMDTGILLVNEEGLVRVMNKASGRLLTPERPLAVEQGRQLADYCPELAYQFEHWKDTGVHRARPFTVMEGTPPVIAHFRELQPNTQQEALVLVEDYTPVTQYAQSLKLTSLGRLTASIAHEIRNPLGAISHAAQLLRESPDLPEADRRMANIIQHHCERVNQIVESVMQISRREPPKPEYLTLSTWLASCIDAYLNALKHPAEIVLDCDYPELLIEFDPENLQRVISNLLDNALRHSKMEIGRESARVEVSLDFAAHQCYLDVIDSGAGVSPADQGKLFEPFFTTVTEGSGMGLYLCKELCEINNANLSYHPTSRGESCFRISMNQRAS